MLVSCISFAEYRCIEIFGLFGGSSSDIHNVCMDNGHILFHIERKYYEE